MTKRASFSALAALGAFAALSFHAITADAAITIGEVNFSGPGGVTLNAVLYSPNGFSTGSNYKAVVMMHGCSGMWSNRDYGAYSGGNPNLMNHVDKWGIKLANVGIVALAVDSFTPRTPVGVTQDDFQDQCSGEPYAGYVDPYTTRVQDARAAYDYLDSYSQIDSAHIGLLGWSHGAQAVMVEAAETIPTANTSRSSGDKIFSASVVFYPGCGLALDFTNTSSVSDSFWRPYTNFRMNMGTLDGFHADCDERMDIAIGTYSAPVEYGEYTGADHSFDGGSQTWPSATCGTHNDTCAMNNADIASLSFFQSYL
jgi:dienelactone hydrolase